MSRTLADFLKTAGLHVTGAPTTPGPKAKTAAVKVANESAASSDSASMPSAEPTGGKDQRTTSDEEETQDTGATPAEQAGKEAQMKTKVAEFLKVAGRTEAQKWLAQNGVFVEDAKVAEHLAAQQLKIAEMQKRAELEKLAEEERARGAIFYQGMVKESTAMRFAFGQAELDDVKKIAAALGISPVAILKRAEELQAAVASSDPALVGDHLGTAARVDSSRVTQAAEENGSTTGFEPEAVAGTRAPVSGDDEKLMRFTDVWTLPGNPGLNLGQAVDQGKGR